jgi:spore coat polysaccharide biosynthesis predicted glycosyltransferase SpsG
MMSDRPLRVLFDTAGGHRAGVGHLLRTLTLVDQLRRRGARVGVIRPIGASAHLSMLLKRARLRPVDASGTRPDIVVVDRPDTTSAGLLRHHTRWPSARLVALDYYGASVDGLTGVINLNPSREKNRRPQPLWRRRGLEYATIRPSFSEWRVVRRTVPLRVKRVLVGFGGTDPTGWTSSAVTALSEMLPPEVEIHVLSGASALSNMRAPVRSHVIVHVSLPDPAALLHASHVAVIGGGTMMIEAACLGVPALVIPRTPEEVGFARQFRRAGAVRVLSPRGSFPASELGREMTRLLRDRPERLRMRSAGRSLVDGRGADRVADLIMATGAGPR